MKIEFWVIGKTSEPWLEQGQAVYLKRLVHYLPVSYVEIPAPKTKSNEPERIKKEEGALIVSKLNPDDYLVLLDENGQEFTSVEMARWMEQRLSDSRRRMVFLVGGAYGFSPDIYQRAQAKFSLSRLTFSHQMVRVFFLEQLYRATTIFKGESYHNP